MKPVRSMWRICDSSFFAVQQLRVENIEGIGTQNVMQDRLHQLCNNRETTVF